MKKLFALLLVSGVMFAFTSCGPKKEEAATEETTTEETTTEEATGNKVLPHGQEWKWEFQQLVRPILNSETFPDKVLSALRNYISNPKASSCSDPSLTEAIRAFDKEKPEISLVNLPQGEKFYFQNRIFIKEELRRT
ncbi:hypothetical protein HMI54_001083, partial [Coelomomyces lativittatus]